MEKWSALKKNEYVDQTKYYPLYRFIKTGLFLLKHTGATILECAQCAY